MAEAARVALRGLAASANAINKNQAMHTPLVLGSLGACCALSWVYGAVFLVDNTHKYKTKDQLVKYGIGELEQ